MFLCALSHTKNAVYAVARRTLLVRPQQRDTIAGSVARRTIRLSSWASSQARGSARPGIRELLDACVVGRGEAGRDAVGWFKKPRSTRYIR